MRGVFGILGLLVVVAIVGLLAKKQLSAGVSPPSTAAIQAGVTVPTGTPKEQVQQFQQAVSGAMQQERAMPEEGK